MPPKKSKATSTVMAPSKVPNLKATQMGSNDGKTKASDHRLDSTGELEGLPMDLDSDPDIDRVLVLEKGFSELSNTTQESIDAFTNTNHVFRDSIQTQVDTLLMAVRALMGMNSPTGPSPIPPLDPAPAPTTGELVGPLPGPASTSAKKQHMPDHQDLANDDTDGSEERIPFYLKRKRVEKSPQGSRADAASPQIPRRPPSEPSSASANLLRLLGAPGCFPGTPGAPGALEPPGA